METISEDLFSIHGLFYKNFQDIENVFQQPGFVRAHFEVLIMLEENDGLPMTKIAKELSISKSYMTAIIDKLFKEGFIKKIPHESDRRVTNIKLSKKGREYALKCKKLMKKDIESKISNLSEEDLLTLQEASIVIKGVLSKITNDQKT